jgi:hypothetical protein
LMIGCSPVWVSVYPMNAGIAVAISATEGGKVEISST